MMKESSSTHRNPQGDRCGNVCAWAKAKTGPLATGREGSGEERILPVVRSYRSYEGRGNIARLEARHNIACNKKLPLAPGQRECCQTRSAS